MKTFSLTPINLSNMKNLKYILTLALFIFLGQTSVNAQSYSKKYKGFEAGHFEIGAGIGLVPTFTTRYVHTKVPPVNMNISYRVKKHFSLGVNAGFTTTHFYSDKPINKVIPREIDSEIFMVGFRAAGHYNMDDLDFYGGGMIGYTVANLDTDIDRRLLAENVETEDLGKSQVTYSGFMGVKYLMTDNLGFYGEFGFGMSLMNVGLVFKL